MGEKQAWADGFQRSIYVTPASRGGGRGEFLGKALISVLGCQEKTETFSLILIRVRQQFLCLAEFQTVTVMKGLEKDRELSSLG